MEPLRTPVAGGTVPSVPYPSLVSEMLPGIREMEEYLVSVLQYAEHIPLWSTSDANYEPLLHALSEVKGKVAEWRRSQLTRLQGKWMTAATEYNAYRHHVDQVLRKRHTAEVQFLFPMLKNAEKESQMDPTSVMMMSEEERSVRAHLVSIGFGYDKTAEGAARRITKLVKRQEKERTVFEATVHNHNEQLACAKKSDVARLHQEMDRSEQLLQGIIGVIEGKIAAASRAQATTLYHKGSPRLGSAAVRSPPRSAGGRAPVAPPSSSNPGGRHILGSARSDRSNATQLHSVLPATARPVTVGDNKR